jgi:hypothetical protein
MRRILFKVIDWFFAKRSVSLKEELGGFLMGYEESSTICIALGILPKSQRMLFKN